MLHSFKEHYLAEAEGETVILNFGRFNPPTSGHEKLLNASMKAANGVHRVYASQSQDAKKNPLGYKDKIKFMRKMFPHHARHIIFDKKVRNFFDVLVKAHKDGFKKAFVVVGSDRVKEFDTVLNKYNGVKARHGFYEFDGGVKVVSAGERDPDDEGVSGMSASKLRAAAKENDLITFTKGMPKGFKGAEDLMNAVRAGMGLKESTDFRKDIKLKRVTMLREKYIEGTLFEVGDEVFITETREKATITHLHTNHVGVSVNGESKNVWISDICKE
jgi:phosphopantetheine adenylyltransferase